jgi:pilus assembly protein Flp/PilA
MSDRPETCVWPVNDDTEVKAPMNAWLRDDGGQGLVEYALIIAVIAIAVIVAMLFMRDQITNIFSNIGNDLT